MSNLEQKVDLLIGVITDLKSKVDGYSGIAPPTHKWISSAELAKMLGMSQRSILNLVHQGKFPDEMVRTRKRGKYNIYKFDGVKVKRHFEEHNGFS